MGASATIWLHAAVQKCLSRVTGRSVSASSGSGMARQDVPANSKVSRYRPLGRPLAHGSYGEVSVAWDSKVNGIVALKKQQAKSETATRELNAYRSLPEHPNVLSILNSFVVDRCLYFAFRYHDSCLWAVWRAARGCLELGEVRRYCKHIFEGLRHMHTHNVCHRDLSLTNLLVSFRDNVVQIADLGLAACAASFALERNVTQLPSRAPEVLLSYDEEEDKEAQSVFCFPLSCLSTFGARALSWVRCTWGSSCSTSSKSGASCKP